MLNDMPDEVTGQGAEEVVKSARVDTLHVDAALIVLNKPAGLPVLPEGWQHDAPHVIAMAEAEFGHIWVVHRLDKTTSGILVLARSAEAHRALSLQFEHHQALKVYHCIANGVPDWDERVTNLRLRANVGHKHRTVADSRSGKPSTTTFRVLERFPGHALIEARPASGRTHQIRVHLAALGFPLLADELYGGAPTHLIARPALHAESLSLVHPISKALVTYQAPYPEDFVAALTGLRHQSS